MRSRRWRGGQGKAQLRPQAVRPSVRRAAGAASALLLLAVLVELRDVGPEVATFLLVLDAGEHHLGAGNFGLRVRDVFEELILVPGDAGALVGVGIVEPFDCAGLAAVEPVEHRPDFVLGAFTDRMTGEALLEGVLAGGDVLRPRALRG